MTTELDDRIQTHLQVLENLDEHYRTTTMSLSNQVEELEQLLSDLYQNTNDVVTPTKIHKTPSKTTYKKSKLSPGKYTKPRSGIVKIKPKM